MIFRLLHASSALFCRSRSDAKGWTYASIINRHGERDYCDLVETDGAYSLCWGRLRQRCCCVDADESFHARFAVSPSWPPVDRMVEHANAFSARVRWPANSRLVVGSGHDGWWNLSAQGISRSFISTRRSGSEGFTGVPGNFCGARSRSPLTLAQVIPFFYIPTG